MLSNSPCETPLCCWTGWTRSINQRTISSYITSILGFKLSLLFSFLRIAAEKRYRVAIIVIATLCTIFNLIFLIVQINICSPVSRPRRRGALVVRGTWPPPSWPRNPNRC